MFDCKKCPEVHETAAESLDHMILHHGFKVGPSPVLPEQPETYSVSPYGLNDQFGLPDYNNGECGDE